MADYENKASNMYFSTNFKATEKLRVFSTVSYYTAEGSLQEVLMPDVEARLDGDLENQDFDMENIPSYSDLDYEFLSFKLGFTYKLTDAVTWSADGDYVDLKDNQGYVYGIESGSYFMIRSGFKVDF